MLPSTTQEMKMSCNPMYNKTKQDKSNYFTIEDTHNNNIKFNNNSNESISIMNNISTYNDNNDTEFTYGNDNENNITSMKLGIQNIYKSQLDDDTILHINSKSKSSTSSIISKKTDISSIYSLPTYKSSSSKLSFNKSTSTISAINNSHTSPDLLKNNLMPDSIIPRLAKRPTLARNHSLSLSIKTHNLSNNTRSRSKTLAATTIKTPVSLTSNNNHYSMNNSTNGNGDKGLWILPGVPFNDISSEDDTNSNNGISIPSPLQEELPIYRRSVYPNGPIQVVSPNIYLYSEPTIDDIIKFDVVINVAEEIHDLKTEIPRNIKETLEYHHIKWSHDSKIAKDLKYLTKIIHEANTKGKRVLVHCQCGVSRSASLIVAYIMRYDELNLNDAYNKLKLVAKDISPNMGLIFQLMEWDEILHDQE
ncbi:similar to Saccharomyces cerevisiae YIL113W SDP1 Stress-inducible dual-specificity MAP kinase phosphatase [Maudiozyma saulgeensis]|uniref:protein-tyrosine-phosphatase n=1 Tax=Maudiozyma saulgeensis TaxID=1789683 RepID=A0A1X7QYW0_9SACH|nr:similar to Saccharomyces cerevisiae YIL113W SDP1 Stress-inducible dual-specificity MAP kinase phosphatase [Kazachstania saulgeensis]